MVPRNHSIFIKGEFQLANYGSQSGSNVGAGNARQKNQQAMNRAGQAGAGATGYEFGTELGATGATGAQTPDTAAGNARQRNQQAMQNAASKAGQTSR